MYFLSVFRGKDREEIVRRRPFTDFSEAVAASGEYYESRARGAVLQFTTEVTGKIFRRAYAHLWSLEDATSEDSNQRRNWIATKQSNAFRFAHSYVFLIESEAGVEQAEEWEREDDQ